MESVGVLLGTVALALGDVSSVPQTDRMVVEDLQPNTQCARTINPEPGDFAFLRAVKGRTRGEVLRWFGHPGKVEHAPGGSESWTYYRTDSKQFWVFFRNGKATMGTPTDGAQFGGAEFRW